MDGLSEYEIERRRNMERNHRKLQDLGLVGPQESVQARPVVRPQRKGAGEASATRRASATAPATVAVRKSLRTRSQPAPVYAENAIGFDDDRGRKRKRLESSPLKPKGSSPQMPPTATDPPAASRRRGQAPLPPNSSRNLECDIPMLLERYLGRRFPSFGKAPVMELSTKSCPPKFSRMSGVTEWKNAVYLWVNVDGDDGYANLFEKDAGPDGGDCVKCDALHEPATAMGERAASSFAHVDEAVAASEGDSSERRKRYEKWRGAIDAGTSAAIGRRPPSPRHAQGEDGMGATSLMSATNGYRTAVGGDACSCHQAAPSSSGETARVSAGLRMTWFAGARMTPESALIQRLLLRGTSPNAAKDVGSSNADAHGMLPGEETNSAPYGVQNNARVDDASGPPAVKTGSMRGSGTCQDSGATLAPSSLGNNLSTADDGSCRPPDHCARTGGSESNDAVLLFCRLPNEPYIFCGRLGYAMHWPAERPMRFVWRLLDAERLSLWPEFGAMLASEKE